MYPSSSLLGHDKDESIVALPVDELIEKADGFAGVFPGTINFWFVSATINSCICYTLCINVD